MFILQGTTPLDEIAAFANSPELLVPSLTLFCEATTKRKTPGDRTPIRVNDKAFWMFAQNSDTMAQLLGFLDAKTIVSPTQIGFMCFEFKSKLVSNTNAKDSLLSKAFVSRDTRRLGAMSKQAFIVVVAPAVNFNDNELLNNSDFLIKTVMKNMIQMGTLSSFIISNYKPEGRFVSLNNMDF